MENYRYKNIQEFRKAVSLTKFFGHNLTQETDVIEYPLKVKVEKAKVIIKPTVVLGDCLDVIWIWQMN